MNRLIPMETYRWAAPLFQCKMSSSVCYMMCWNCQIPLFPGFTLSLSSRNSSLASSTRKQLKWSTRWISNQALSVLLLCLNICTISYSCNIGRWKQCFLDNIETWSSLQPLSTGDIKCSQLYSCKYQRLLITFINFNQSVSRLTILIMMTALTKEASVKTSLAFNQQ